MTARIVRPLLASIYLIHLAAFPVDAKVKDPPEETSVQVLDVRPDNDGIVLELSQIMPFEVFTLSSPWRLVIEIPGTYYRTGFNKKNINSNLIRRVRGYQFKENPPVSRVVLDLKAPVDYNSYAEGSNIFVSLRRNEVIAKKESQTQSKKKSQKKIRRKRDLLSTLPRENVTLDFEGADIRDVIRLMAETSNVNIIFGPEVTGTISIHLRRVPFDEAFRTILNLKGLVASQLGTNILRVTTPDLIQKEQTKAVVYTKTVPVNYLKAKEMMKHIQAVMNAAGRKGTITVAEELNSLVITDTQEGIATAERLISQLDQKPKQVMIETRIVEINLNNGLDIGVQWEFAHTKNSGGNSTIIGQEDSSGGRVPLTRPGETTSVGAFGPASAGTGVNLPGPTAAGITFGFINSDSIISASLAALVEQSRAKILSSPKVVTINGKEARIEAVQDIPFRTSTVSGTGVVSNSFESVSAGIILTVTPTINAQDSITLKINPVSSFPTQESTEAGPIIRTRNAETTVIIKDGNTLVIGGLIDDQDTKGVSKVPLLGDIPIIGTFFRSTTNRKIRNELLVFVTPRIIRE